MSIIGTFSEEITSFYYSFAETRPPRPRGESVMATTSNLSAVSESQAAGSSLQATTSSSTSLLSQLRASMLSVG